jgi:hypothetical protein
MNLSKIKRKFPKDYDYFPNTYLLTYDYDRFIFIIYTWFLIGLLPKEIRQQISNFGFLNLVMVQEVLELEWSPRNPR